MTEETVVPAPVPAIPVPDIGPVVFVLDRTASMATRDCPDGMSRWTYALSALRATLAEMHSHDPSQPVTVLTCGSTVTNVPVLAGKAQHEIVDVHNGDASFCVGQAALEAAWHADGGAVVIIADGPPVLDTKVGELVLQSHVAMQALFSRTYFLTVGEVSAELEAFAARWPHFDRLERMLNGVVDNERLTATETLERMLNGLEDDEPLTAAETADTEPPPPAVDEGSAPKSKAKRGR